MEFINFSKYLTKVSVFWIILFLCGLNLLIMHYGVAKETYLFDALKFSMLAGCVLGVFVDLLIILLVSYFLFFNRIKLALVVTFFVTLLWSFSNVLYSRFFHHYITFSAIEQVGNIVNVEMMKCVVGELEYVDIYYLLCVILFLFLFLKMRNICINISNSMKFVIISLILYELFVLFYYFNISRSFPLYDSNGFSFRQGSVSSLVIEFRNYYNTSKKLSNDQISHINNIKQNHCKRIYSYEGKNNTNVVLILVESFMSFVIDMKISGRDVTPFLNSLKNDSTIYYNGNMNENVTLGESSDGQFIYMTGLLPLRSSITVSKVRTNTLPGLPKVFGNNSWMIIPTKKEMWLQDEMCHKYGFSMLYTCDDIDNGRNSYLNDEQIFRLAIEKDLSSKQPFLSIILTMSMHQPYTKQIDQSFFINESSIPEDLACYLNACHYTDTQIKRYFDHLKQTGLYDNSLIIIASDHSVHNTDFGGVSKKLPLFLINTGISPSDMWGGECNQLDVYTTLLDLIGGENDWCGLGHSLVSSSYINSVSNHIWDISEWIIMGDYFSTK